MIWNRTYNKYPGGTKVKAMIFDIDGTLLQSDVNDDAPVLGISSLRYLAMSACVRPGGCIHNSLFSGILAEILNDNAIETTSERVGAVRDHFVESVRRHLSEQGPFVEMPGARTFVQNLHNSTMYRIAYATGGWRGSALLKLSLSGFPITGLATSDDHFQRKEIMLNALRQLNRVFETVTYYGDGHWDAVAAKALGWQFVPVGTKLNGLTRYEQCVS
ncbi:LOW QUALITY PROTEIN: phosphoglycolate phosphatase-like HAD superfamily hydrolase [Dulcicalothrix desertica PCC 7102]|nr:LOW QUALITY PROTEIN: phosphoglycolate phosphatase-like HAD superfamily hydrolase [Dulcicalothrix desertica PCC 7102]